METETLGRLVGRRFHKSELFRPPFLEYFPSWFDASSSCTLFFFRKLNDFFAFVGTGILHLFLARFALNEKKVATYIEAVGVFVARSTALMAMSNHFV